MSAEFRTLCHSLGLSAQDLAQVCQVQERTVRHWWADGSPPDAVVLQVKTLDAQFEQAVIEALELVSQKTDERGKPESVDLLAYKTTESLWSARADMRGLPVQSHSVLLWRLKKALSEIGISVNIHY